MITSLTNNEIKEVCKLNNAKYRNEKGLFLVEGPHLVEEAKRLGILVSAYTTLDSLEGTLVSEGVMKKLCSTLSPVPQIGVCKMGLSSKLNSRVLILDGIQDPGNMGTLMRSAVAFGFLTVFIGNGSVDIFNSKVIRSSQGAFFKLSFRFGDVSDFISKDLTTYHVFSTDVKNGLDARVADGSGNIGLILGNEGNGVSTQVKTLGLDNLNIKMNNTESLNVGIAGSILMYELSNQ